MSSLPYAAFDCDNHYYEAGQAQAFDAGRTEHTVAERDGASEAVAA